MAATLTAPALTASAAARPAVGGSPLRLTRRGRLVVLGLFVLALLVFAGAGRLAGRADAADPAGATTGPVAESWVVQPGETLWAIAEQVAPEVDPRETVARIVELNDLPDSSVQAGQAVFVPAS
jgi:nucleoid-associated protein YgaU